MAADKEEEARRFKDYIREAVQESLQDIAIPTKHSSHRSTQPKSSYASPEESVSELSSDPEEAGPVIFDCNLVGPLVEAIK